MISINLCFLALFLACVRKIPIQHTKRNLYQFAFALILLTLCNIPIYGYGLSAYYVSFFSTPCALSLVLSSVYIILRVSCLYTKHTNTEHAKTLEMFPFRVRMLWFVVGLVLYLGVLGIYGVDIYYIDSRAQVGIMLCVIVVGFMMSRAFGLLSIITLLYGVFVGDVYGALFDVGLWALCALSILWRVITHFTQSPKILR